MCSSRAVRIIYITVSGLLLVLGLAGPVLAQAPHVLLLDVGGVINPVKERLIARTIEQAERDKAALVVIELDTPGGLVTSTRVIVEELLEADVPTVVYVSPRGAQAGSAGTFITVAANFAVMAPGTNIGAATPVSATGQDLNETLANKATNDAAALIRSIAQERGRNAEKLEETVREAASFTATEALELNVIDFIASDLDDLLAQLNGQTVATSAGASTLDTRDLQLRRVDKSLLEHFLEFISNPNVSFILLTVGGLGIVAEIFNPGLIFPGVIGVIALLLAFLALGNLPVNWAGVAFIGLAIVLAVLEAQVAGWGILGVGAIISFVVGGLILFSQFGGASPTLPPIGVNRWLLAGVTGSMALALLYLVRVVVQSRRGGTEDQRPSLIGQTAIVASKLAPRGVVRVGNETWTAISENGTVIAPGETVTVTGIDGLILTVSPQSDSESSTAQSV
jgi:membrane-bound serine protease (ClpP class)